MLIDLTLRVTPRMILDAHGNEKMSYTGHLGTHFDVMDKEFPLEYTERQGIVFDVSHVKDQEIDILDIDMDEVLQDMFVAFYTGFIDKVGYGSQASPAVWRHGERVRKEKSDEGTYGEWISACKGQYIHTTKLTPAFEVRLYTLYRQKQSRDIFKDHVLRKMGAKS